MGHLADLPLYTHLFPLRTCSTSSCTMHSQTNKEEKKAVLGDADPSLFPSYILSFPSQNNPVPNLHTHTHVIYKPQEEKKAVLGDADPYWMDLRHCHIAEVSFSFNHNYCIWFMGVLYIWDGYVLIARGGTVGSLGERRLLPAFFSVLSQSVLPPAQFTIFSKTLPSYQIYRPLSG
jgi:hypothetical protein